MYNITSILKEKEKRLVHYLEIYSTKEILKEAQKCIPSYHDNSDILDKLNEMKIPQPVINTLIIYDFTINKEKPLTNKTLVYAELCKKLNINNAQDAISFFKQHYLSNA